MSKSPCSLGYVLHPAVFDGTIHSLGTASVGKNVNDLKIFGGVGRVSIIQTENFSQHEAWPEQMCSHSSNVPSPSSIVLPLGGSFSIDFTPSPVLTRPMIQLINPLFAQVEIQQFGRLTLESAVCF